MITWELGTLKMPSSINYKLPEIEDHFYLMDEIYSPEPESTEGKISSIYPLIGVLLVILLPWISFVKMVTFVFILYF